MAMTLKQQAMQDFIPRGRGRPDYGTVKVTERLEPVAKPAEAYFQPAQVMKSPLEDLAKSLSPISANLNGLLSEMSKETEKAQKETDQAEAERMFVESNQQGYADAVKEGKIPAQASPVFMERYKQLEGDKRGRELAARLETDFNQWDRKDTATPQEVSAWLAEKVKADLNGADPKALRSALPHVLKIQERLTNLNVKGVNDKFINDSLDNIKASTREIIAAGYRESQLDSKDIPTFSPGNAAREIDALTSRMKAAGVRGAELNSAVVDAVTEEAIKRNDPSILEILKRDRSNGTPGPGLTSYGQQMIEKAEDRIYRNMERMENAAHRRQEREFKQGNRLATRHVVDALTKNPDADIDPTIIELGSRHDPDFALKVEKMREQIQKRNESDHPADLRDAQRRIWESDRPTAQVMEEVASGSIRNPATMRSLLNDAARIESARGKGSGSFNLDVFKRTKEAIAKATDPYGQEKNNPDQINSRAVFDFEMAIADWDARNPEATQIERMKKVKEIGDVFIGAIDKNTNEYKAPDIKAMTRNQADSAATSEGQRSYIRPAPRGVEQRGDAGGTAQAPTQFSQYIEEASRLTGIPANILTGKIQQESSFNPDAVSPTGAIGLAQILPSTARDPGYGMTGIDPASLRDPRTNILFGAQYLAARARALGVDPKDLGDPAKAAPVLRAYNGNDDASYAEKVLRYAGVSGSPQGDLRNRTLGAAASPSREMVIGAGGAVEWMQRRIEELEGGGDAEHGPAFSKTSFKSKHYTWQDFRNDRFEGASISQKAVAALDRVTDQIGKKLQLTSGYRSPEYNNQVSHTGKAGQHTHGTAIDFKVDQYTDAEKAQIMALFIKEGAVGFGHYHNGSMHVDFRSTPGRGPGGLAIWGQGETPTWFLAGMRDGLKTRSGSK